MMMLKNELLSISDEIGIINALYGLPRENGDPRIINFGVGHCNTVSLGGKPFAGESAGCGYSQETALMGAIGETMERYAPSFVREEELRWGSYMDFKDCSIPPETFALFHPKQYETPEFRKIITPFSYDKRILWTDVYDLTEGGGAMIPSQFVYRPLPSEKILINPTTTTGLAAHTCFYKAVLNALYETVERDSFAITWFQKIVPAKIVVTGELKDFLSEKFNPFYEWHLFDMTYDLGIPATFGFCFGKAEFGEFVAVGASCRCTIEESLKKTIMEIGQSIPYFRHMLGENRHNPKLKKNELWDFSHHSYYYLEDSRRWTAFERWREARPVKKVDFLKKSEISDINQIKSIIKVLKAHGYNLYLKDLTTPDLRQLGFFCVRVYIPQLIQLSGAYGFYHLGGERLYEVPKKMGFHSCDYYELNDDPHPFP